MESTERQGEAFFLQKRSEHTVIEEGRTEKTTETVTKFRIGRRLIWFVVFAGIAMVSFEHRDEILQLLL